MKEKRASGHAGGRLKKTYNTKWILAWAPDTRHYELMMKVPNTRQCYETVSTPSRYFDMDYLLQVSDREGVFSPVAHPKFIRKNQKCT